MKTLETIQKLAKVGKTLSKIAFIFSIIGAVGTAVGIGGVAVLGDDALKLGGDSVTSAIQNESDMDIPAMIAAMVVGMVFLIAQIFISKFAEIYFKNELRTGHPLRFGVPKNCFASVSSALPYLSEQLSSAVSVSALLPTSFPPLKKPAMK